MKLRTLALALAIVSSAGAADAHGCIKGAIVGGVAGHFAHHHTWTGAAIGCVVGHHMAVVKHRREEQARQRH